MGRGPSNLQPALSAILHLPSCIFHLLSSSFYRLSSTCCLVSSIFYFLSSVFCLPLLQLRVSASGLFYPAGPANSAQPSQSTQPVHASQPAQQVHPAQQAEAGAASSATPAHPQITTICTGVGIFLVFWLAFAGVLTWCRLKPMHLRTKGVDNICNNSQPSEPSQLRQPSQPS